MRGEATSLRGGPAPVAARAVARWVLVTLALAAVLAALVGLAFAGSPARIAEGVAIAGIDVGGLTKQEARQLLESRFERGSRVPGVITPPGGQLPLRATTQSVEADGARRVLAGVGDQLADHELGDLHRAGRHRQAVLRPRPGQERGGEMTRLGYPGAVLVQGVRSPQPRCPWRPVPLVDWNWFHPVRLHSPITPRDYPHRSPARH